jgi:flavin-dependent dehydrogenase
MNIHSSKVTADYDVIVVGARAAGAATALNLARGGARVLMVDRAPAGSDTLSTHAIMRLGVNLLDRWGVLPKLVAAGTPVIRRTIFQYGVDRVEIAIKPDGAVEGLLAPRRQLLDRVLAEAACDAGVEWAAGVSLEGLLRKDATRVGGAVLRDTNSHRFEVTADMVVGADGHNSTVAKLVGSKAYEVSRNTTASIYGYFDAPADDAYNWVFMPGFTGGIIPTNNGQVCAFISVPPDQLKCAFGDDPLAGLIDHFAQADHGLAEQLRSAGPPERLRRFPGAPGHLRQSYGPGWALVGDAGYFKDPATAHGITDALRDGEALARAILSVKPGSLRLYQENRDRLSGNLFAVTNRIAALDWSMPELKRLHIELANSMKAEVKDVDRDGLAVAA